MTGSLFLAEGSKVRPECTNYAASLQKVTAGYVTTVAPHGAGTTPGMLGFTFWAAERPSSRGSPRSAQRVREWDGRRRDGPRDPGPDARAPPAARSPR